ncbi:DUF305 domain-containing protein [Streptomyces sp. V3I7]|uniref:DUF305 domain-containing protein n=1 Tax=Streptomyces sp. V3I7 TaxID=3042278 RepID=UPI0027853F11|nr:DUF305 domain-containing protein [Streptomyces sp. V3I7]MDQ0989068.1 uncharacterized protein (DUF305 family) [Streptomyces sp. V3I7]
MTIRRRARDVRRWATVVTAAAAVLVLGACDGEGRQHTAKDSGPRTVVAPGKPGEPAKKLSANEAAKAARTDTPNDADVMYAQMMIQHHAQALLMSELAPKQASDSRVKRLAGRITASQGPEMGAMRGWLAQHGETEQPVGHMHEHGHDHGTMPGMATEQQLAELRAAKGNAFDALFLTLMTTHHEGALTMAEDVLRKGRNAQIEEMATEVIAVQSAEIKRMRAMG